MKSEAIAIFLDVDGTLIDSAGQLFDDCRRAAEKLGLKIPSDEDFSAVWASPWPQFVNALWPDFDFDAFNEQFEEGPAEALSGAREIVSWLRERQFFLALISNRARASLSSRMEQVEMPLELFDYVQAVDDYEFIKPDPRVFNHALSLLSGKGISASKAIFVGDALSDCEAAMGAGIIFIAVLTGVTTREQFIAAGLAEEFILNSVKDIPEFLQKLLA